MRRQPPVEPVAFLCAYAGPRRSHAAAAIAAAACCVLSLPLRPNLASPVAAPISLPSSSVPPAIFDRTFRLSPLDDSQPPSSHLTWHRPLPSPAAASAARLTQQTATRGLTAMLCGAVIGWERRVSRSLLGVRVCTMVSLGTFFVFLIAASHPPVDGGLGRAVGSAATAIGFLGKEIFLLSQRRAKGSPSRRTGLTTATTIWLAAASGIAASAGLLLTAFTCAFATVGIARYLRLNDAWEFLGPDMDEEEEEEEDEEEGE